MEIRDWRKNFLLLIWCVNSPFCMKLYSRKIALIWNHLTTDSVRIENFRNFEVWHWFGIIEAEGCKQEVRHREHCSAARVLLYIMVHATSVASTACNTSVVKILGHTRCGLAGHTTEDESKFYECVVDACFTNAVRKRLGQWWSPGPQTHECGGAEENSVMGAKWFPDKPLKIPRQARRHNSHGISGGSPGRVWVGDRPRLWSIQGPSVLGTEVRRPSRKIPWWILEAEETTWTTTMPESTHTKVTKSTPDFSAEIQHGSARQKT